ncbi:lysoplasmalogenase family protein [Oryzobacter terrae]|uniref:lysoplasmalogenase family protein n=1 Tax=Oryzobacter terrae TaxID=1620385 RepID=UPI00366E56C1
MPPRRPLRRLVLAGLVVVTAVHLAAQLTGTAVLADVTQVLLMPLLAAVLRLATSAPRGRLVRLTLAALGLSWLGDSLPRLAEGDAAFLLMVGFFLLAQVAYVAAFLPHRRRSVLHRRRVLLLPYVAVVAALVAACAGGAGGLLVPVLVYGALLGAAAVLSTGVNTLTAAGGALFLVSDGLIALDAFADGFALPGQGFWVMATYVAAQSLLVAGVLRAVGSGHARARVDH